MVAYKSGKIEEKKGEENTSTDKDHRDDVGGVLYCLIIIEKRTAKWI